MFVVIILRFINRLLKIEKLVNLMIFGKVIKQKDFIIFYSQSFFFLIYFFDSKLFTMVGDIYFLFPCLIIKSSAEFLTI